MEQITSAQNNRIKQANKLKKKRERDKTGLALIEGVHLIEEAYQRGIVITQLFAIEPARLDQQIIAYAQEVFEINMKVAESLSGTVTPQGFSQSLRSHNMIFLKHNKYCLSIVFKILEI